MRGAALWQKEEAMAAVAVPAVGRDGPERY